MHFLDFLDLSVVTMTVCHPLFNTLVLSVMFVDSHGSPSPACSFHISVCQYVQQVVKSHFTEDNLVCPKSGAFSVACQHIKSPSHFFSSTFQFLLGHDVMKGTDLLCSRDSSENPGYLPSPSPFTKARHAAYVGSFSLFL